MSTLNRAMGSVGRTVDERPRLVAGLLFAIILFFALACTLNDAGTLDPRETPRGIDLEKPIRMPPREGVELGRDLMLFTHSGRSSQR